jgi:hypothetical protein
MYSICPSWMISVVSFVGKSGRLLVAWNPNIFELHPFLSVGGILLTGIHIPDKRRISFLNAYGSRSGRWQFWEQVEAKGLLAQDDLILAGDLKFFTSTNEVWGEVALSDPMADFFKNLFANNQLVDVKPTVLMPTWRNGRRGVEEIQKRLDRVYVSETILCDAARYRSWVELPFVSDHAPVILQLDYGYKPVAYPFKFNPSMLERGVIL